MTIHGTVANYSSIDLECMAFDPTTRDIVMVEKNHKEESANVFRLTVEGKDEQIRRGDVLQAETVGKTVVIYYVNTILF